MKAQRTYGQVLEGVDVGICGPTWARKQEYPREIILPSIGDHYPRYLITMIRTIAGEVGSVNFCYFIFFLKNII